MIEPGSGPRPGARDNGLRCAGYVAAGDLDPRVADALLDALRSEGIAAYASPTPAARGGYLEMRLPNQLTDRVFVDAEKTVRAMQLFEEEKADTATANPASTPSPASPADIDTAWQALLTSLKTPSEAATWPTREDVPEGEPADLFTAAQLGAPGLGPRDYTVPDDPDDEHYVPPKPPPLPRLRSVTIASLAAIFGGILIVVTGIDGGDLGWLGIIGIIGGAVAIVWHMKDRPTADSGWDDGAVV